MNFWQNVISLVISVLSEIIELFPLADSDTLELYDSQVSAFKSYTASANWLFPVDTFFLLLSAIITIELSLFTYRFAKFIIRNVSFGIFKG